MMAKPIGGRYLSFAEREEIGLLCAQEVGVREIARRLGAVDEDVVHRRAGSRLAGGAKWSAAWRRSKV